MVGSNVSLSWADKVTQDDLTEKDLTVNALVALNDYFALAHIHKKLEQVSGAKYWDVVSKLSNIIHVPNTLQYLFRDRVGDDKDDVVGDGPGDLKRFTDTVPHREPRTMGSLESELQGILGPIVGAEELLAGALMQVRIVMRQAYPVQVRNPG